MAQSYWRCRTEGCPFVREVDIRNGRPHTCCCSRCYRLGNGHHSRRCSQLRLADVYSSSRSSTSARAPDFASPATRVQSEDVRDGTHEVRHSAIRRVMFFRMPENHCWRKGSIFEFIDYFSKWHGRRLSDDAVVEWKAFGEYLGRVPSKQEDIEIHAYPIDECPAGIRYINLHCGAFSGCDARGAGDMGTLTGCRPEVMAELITFPWTPLALRIAVADIEMFKLKRFAFLCLFGTHRSVAFTCLLAYIFYTDARVGFHTSRVRADAERLFYLSDPSKE